MDGLNRLAFTMPLFSFRAGDAQHISTSESCELESREAAWKELTGVCGDLVGASCRNLGQNCEWSMELLDADQAPLFRIRLVAETLVPAGLAPRLDATPS
jgi:hypothetical protein